MAHIKDTVVKAHLCVGKWRNNTTSRFCLLQANILDREGAYWVQEVDKVKYERVSFDDPVVDRPHKAAGVVDVQNVKVLIPSHLPRLLHHCI